MMGITCIAVSVLEDGSAANPSRATSADRSLVSGSGFTSLKERAGVKGCTAPFVWFPGGLRACRVEGRGQGGAPGWTYDLDAGSRLGSRSRGPENGIGLVVARPRARSCPGQARGCV